MPRLASPDFLFPSLQFRYTIISSKLPGAALYARSCELPSLSQNAITAYHINDSMKVKGRTNWNPITFNCYTYELITVNDIWKYFKEHQLPDDPIDLDPSSYKADFTITVLNPMEVPINIWSVKDALMTDVKFGEVDWGTDDPINATVTLEYDFAIKVF